jgi:hypothetical protein
MRERILKGVENGNYNLVTNIFRNIGINGECGTAILAASFESSGRHKGRSNMNVIYGSLVKERGKVKFNKSK